MLFEATGVIAILPLQLYTAACMITLGSLVLEMLLATAHKDVLYREAAAAKREELKRAEEELMEARRQELLSEEDGYWRQRMDQQLVVEKLKAEVAEQEELKGNSEVSLFSHAAHQQKFMCNKSCVPSCNTVCMFCSGTPETMQNAHACTSVRTGKTCS